MAKKQVKMKASDISTRQRKVLTDLNVPTYYSNTIELAMSASDFRIKVGEILEATDKELIVRHRATIFFSPRHAKEVSSLLAGKVKEYENTYGEIKPNR